MFSCLPGPEVRNKKKAADEAGLVAAEILASLGLFPGAVLNHSSS